MSFRAALQTPRAHWVIAGVLLVTFIVLSWMQRVPSITTANDDATYILLSRSIRDGGYHSIHLVGEPIHTKYPPVYPALLALTALVGGESTDFFAAVNIALVALALALVFSVARRITTAVVALGALAIAATATALQGLAGTVMSESAFLALVAATLWLYHEHTERKRRVALACVCAVLAMLTRTVGATLVLALMCVLVSRRQWRVLAALGGVLLVAAGGLAVYLHVTGASPYGAAYLTDAFGHRPGAPNDPLSLLADRMITNGTAYAASVLWMLSVPTIENTLVDNLLALAIVIVGLAFGARPLWRRWPIAVAFVAAYGGLILLWQWPVPRFLVPLLPLVALGFLVGIHDVVARRTATGALITVAVVSVILVSSGLVRSHRAAAVRMACPRSAPLTSPSCFNADQLSFFEAASHVRDAVPRSAIVVASKEATFHYLTGLKTIAIDSINARPPTATPALLRDNGVDIVLLSHLSSDDVQLAHRLLPMCARLAVDRSFPPRTFVFRVAPDERLPASACESLRRFITTADHFRPQIF